MSRAQWKAYFSMHILGQTHPIDNPQPASSEARPDDWSNQSYPWMAIVMNFEYYHSRNDNTNKYDPDDYCRCCGYPSDTYYCGYCEADRCAGCGEIGIGSYMCRPCRQMERD